MLRFLGVASAAAALLLAPSVSLAAPNHADKAWGNTNYGDSHIDFNATSNADGSNPSGSATDLHFNGLAYNGRAMDVWGNVTCLNVKGNEAAIGFVVTSAKHSSDQTTASEVVGQGLVLYVQDGGSDSVSDWFSNSGWTTAAEASTGSATCQAQALGSGNAGYYPGNAFHVTDR